MTNPLKKSSLTLYVMVLAFVLITGFIGWCTKFSGFNSPDSIMADNFRLALIVFNLILIISSMGLLVKSGSMTKRKNIFVSGLSLLFILFLLEGVFMFVPKSYGKGDPNNLAERLWFTKYWEVNELGYRDVKFDPKSDQNKFKIAILGDSFVAGHGIKNVNDRFSNILESKLGSSAYRVYNMGLNGADTQTEFDRLVTFPIKPNLIILVHYPNDIERVPDRSITSSFNEDKIARVHARLLNITLWSSLIQNSYLLNYFHYKFESSAKIYPNSHRGKTTADHMMEERNKANYQAFYLREEMFNEHLRNLSRFVSLTEREGIPMMLMLLPETWDETIDYSAEYVNKPINQLFSQLGVPVLDLYNLLKEISIEERVVSNRDAHLSVHSNEQIGSRLYEFVIHNHLITN